MHRAQRTAQWFVYEVTGGGPFSAAFLKTFTRSRNARSTHHFTDHNDTWNINPVHATLDWPCGRRFEQWQSSEQSELSKESSDLEREAWHYAQRYVDNWWAGDGYRTLRSALDRSRVRSLADSTADCTVVAKHCELFKYHDARQYFALNWNKQNQATFIFKEGGLYWIDSNSSIELNF